MASVKHDLVSTLSSQEEVPPIDSKATGIAEFTPVIPYNETVVFNVNLWLNNEYEVETESILQFVEKCSIIKEIISSV